MYTYSVIMQLILPHFQPPYSKTKAPVPRNLVSMNRQHCRLSICDYWWSWTNTEAKIQITLLILRRGALSSQSTLTSVEGKDA